MSVIEFGYWPVKGLGEKTRWLLAYLGLEYVETNPEFGEWFAPSGAKSKSSYGLAFPNVPYIRDGSTRLTESEAINTYLVVKAGQSELLGSTAEEHRPASMRSMRLA